MTESGRVEIAAAPISKKVYVHDPALPRSAQTDTNSIIVVTNRNRVRFEKLRRNDQYDYKMSVDAVEMLPQTWKHAGLPPDGTFAPKHTSDSGDLLRNRYSDYDRFTILVMAACNLVMRVVALSDNDQKPEEVKASLEPAKPLPSGEGLVDFAPPITNWQLRDELDEKRMTYALGMLVRLFYRGDGETDERDWREQEIRKAAILYMGGTGGTNQFINFTSLFMSLELAVGFAKSKCITPNDDCHKAAALLIDTIHWDGIDPTTSKSPLVKSCRAILGDVMAGRVNEYIALDNRLKHYGRDTRDAKYFDSNIDKIYEIMRGLRVDAAYVILLGLTRLYGTGSPPARANKARRTSQFMLGMIEDCVDRHSAESVDGGAEPKIQRLMDFIENDAIKSRQVTYDDTRQVLRILMMCVKAARMLGAPDEMEGVRALVRECEDVVPDIFKPAKLKFDVEHDEEALCGWLEFIASTSKSDPTTSSQL